MKYKEGDCFGHGKPCGRVVVQYMGVKVPYCLDKKFYDFHVESVNDFGENNSQKGAIGVDSTSSAQGG